MALTRDANGQFILKSFFQRMSMVLHLERNRILTGTEHIPLQPRELEKTVLKALTQGVRQFNNNIYLPNHITLLINSTDMTQIKPYLRTFQQELAESIRMQVNEYFMQAKNADCTTIIEIIENSDLKPGEARCETKLYDNPPQ